VRRAIQELNRCDVFGLMTFDERYRHIVGYLFHELPGQVERDTDDPDRQTITKVLREQARAQASWDAWHPAVPGGNIVTVVPAEPGIRIVHPDPQEGYVAVVGWVWCDNGDLLASCTRFDDPRPFLFDPDLYACVRMKAGPKAGRVNLPERSAPNRGSDA
jgi:hypothetical protein